MGRKNNVNDISPLKLQKILYLTYLDYTKNTKAPLFQEAFEVWKQGPIVENVFNYFRQYGSTVITENFIEKENLSKNVRQSIEAVLKKYGRISAWNLVHETHKEGGLWYQKMEANENKIHFKDIKKALLEEKEK